MKLSARARLCAGYLELVGADERVEAAFEHLGEGVQELAVAAFEQLVGGGRRG